MEDKSPLPPCLPAIPSFKIADGRIFTQQSYEPFFSASHVAKNKMLADIEHLGRKKDAAAFLIEAKMGLWDIRESVAYGDTEWDFHTVEKGKGPEKTKFFYLCNGIKREF